VVMRLAGRSKAAIAREDEAGASQAEQPHG